MSTPRRKVCDLTGGGNSAAAVALVLMVLGSAGCQSHTYRATNLPAEFLAPPTENIEEINLSRLTTLPVNSQLIDRGDVLEVTLITDFGNLTSTTTPVRVGEDEQGTANIPLIGPVALAGFELEGAEQVIAAAAIDRGVFQRPHVTVTMKRKRTIKIMVTGAVPETGEIELPRNSSSLLAALVAAGGLTEDAGRIVEIRHPRPPGTAPDPRQPPGQRVAGGGDGYQPVQPGPAYGAQITSVNLASAIAEGNGGGYLRDGDVIHVTKRVPKPIYVMGLVRQPGEFELPPNQDVYMLGALAKAGGRSMQMANKVFIIRRVAGRQEPIVIQTSIRDAKVNGLANVRLAPGDIVSVEESPATIFLDTLKSFIRFGVTSSLPLF